AAKGVARKLVQENQQGQGAIPVVRPRVEFAALRSLVGPQEAGAKVVVESLVLAKPARRAGVAPEGQDVLGLNRQQGRGGHPAILHALPGCRCWRRGRGGGGND